MTSTFVKLVTFIVCVIIVVLLYLLALDASRMQNTLSVHNTIKSPYPSSVELLSASEVVKLPIGLYEVMPWTEFNATEEVPGDMELAYHKLQNRINMQCIDRMRLGNWGDGGWDICLAGIYKPKMTDCLVYSFGIGNDWSFDDAITKLFNCTLRAFDPTIDPDPHMRGKHIHFYPVGLFGDNAKIKLEGGSERPVKTLNTLRKQFQEDTKVIDYLKIDIEGSEWSALRAMFKEGFLQHYVKQIGMEFHYIKNHTNHTNMISIINQLESLGFRKWMNSWNMHCVAVDSKSLHTTSCYEVYFVNLNFLK